MKSNIIVILVLILGILPKGHAWSTPVHNGIILKAFPNESIDCILKMFEGSRYVDEYQGNPLSYLHAMRSSNQEDEEAIKMTWDFVALQYDKAGEPNISEEDFCYYRGMALHPVMDSTSLAHQHGDKPLEWHNPLESWQDLSNPMNIFRAIFLHGDEWQAEAIPYVKEFLRLSGIYLKPGTLESLDLSLEDTVFIEKHPEFVDLTVGLVKLVDQVYLLGVERNQNDNLFDSKDEEVDKTIRYNEVRQISSHNSYDFDGLKPGLQEQADKGVRSFEFDLNKGHTFPRMGNYDHSEWGIYHNTDWQHGGDHCEKLSQCLTQLKEWHAQNESHEVITIWLELDDWETGGHFPVDLNKALENILGDLPYTPTQLLQSCPAAKDLQEAVELCGWPTLEELRGKFIIVLQGNNEAAEIYLDHVNGGNAGNKVSFVAFDVDNCGPIKNNRNSIFFNINTDESYVAECVYQNKFISRVWEIDSQEQWNEALNYHVHHLATNHVTQDFFNPRIMDNQGNQLEPMIQGSTPAETSPQEEVGIDEIKVHVHTNDDNKDHNTGVEFQTFSLDGGLIAETGVMRGEEYEDGSDKYFTLTKKNPLLKQNLLNGGKLRICIDPRGGFKRDTWKFNADITIRYLDGSQTTRNWNEVIVSQNKKEEYLSWGGQ